MTHDYSKEWAEVVAHAKTWLNTDEPTCPLQEDEVIVWADERIKELERSLKQITHCEKCGGDWVDNGLQGDCHCTTIKELEHELNDARNGRLPT